MSAWEEGSKFHQDNKTISNVKMCLVKFYDTKDHKGTMIEVKGEGNTYNLNFDDEEDIEVHFKCKRATKEFGKAIMDRLKIVDGKLDLDWTGIKRIALEKREKALKEAEQKKRAEESAKQKEIEKAAQIEREKKAKAEAERLKILEEKKAAEKAEAQRKLEEQRRADEEKKRIEEEAKEKQRQKMEFMNKIAGAAGGTMTAEKLKELKKNHGTEDTSSDVITGDAPVVSENVTKQWSAERKSYFWLDETNGDIWWRDPSVSSAWLKQFSEGKDAFEYRHKMTGELLDEPPFSKRYDTLWVPEFDRWRYVNKETGDVYEDEPFY